MSSIRFVVLSVALAATAAALAPLPVSARSLGGMSIDTSAPPVPSPGPWGGVYLCTAHLRKYDGIDAYGNPKWLYHMASGYDVTTCMNNAQLYLGLGYQPNPNPGTGFCTCHAGYNGMVISSPDGNGPIVGHDLSPAATQAYSEGLLELRKRYNFDQMAKEQDALLEAVLAADGQGGD